MATNEKNIKENGKKNEDRYNRRGVSSGKEDVKMAIKNLDKGLFPKAFCKIVPDYLTGNGRFCIAMHGDGAGTKSSLAYAYWKETGDLSVWKGIAQDALIMNIDDLLCIGTNGNILVNSTIGRNKNLIPAEVTSAIINGMDELCAELSELSGRKVVLTGGETADLGDLVRTVVVDATVVTRMKREEVIIPNIRPRYVIVSFASYGQTTYEKRYNGGTGSNGLTSARHEVFDKYLANKYPETYDHLMPEELVYCGPYKLTDMVEELGLSMGQLVLSPTRTYLPVVYAILNQIRREHIGAMIHCSGGGQTKVLNFIENLHIVKDNLFPEPILFERIQKASGTSWEEMYRTFNMGGRFEIYVEEPIAEKIIQIAKGFNLDARITGYAEAYEGKKLTIKTEHGEFVYEQ